MNLMPLSPASRRLRDAARAYVAGEMSRRAYRNLRTEIIRDMEAAGQERQDVDETQRRNDHASVSDWLQLSTFEHGAMSRPTLALESDNPGVLERTLDTHERSLEQTLDTHGTPDAAAPPVQASNRRSLLGVQKLTAQLDASLGQEHASAEREDLNVMDVPAALDVPARGLLGVPEGFLPEGSTEGESASRTSDEIPSQPAMSDKEPGGSPILGAQSTLQNPRKSKVPVPATWVSKVPAHCRKRGAPGTVVPGRGGCWGWRC